MSDLGHDAIMDIQNRLRLGIGGEMGELFTEDGALGRRRAEFTLFSACEEGNVDRVHSIIAEGDDDLMYTEDDGCNTLVHVAMISDNLDMTRCTLDVLALSANPHNIYRISLLHFVASAKSSGMVGLLLTSGGAYVDALVFIAFSRFSSK